MIDRWLGRAAQTTATVFRLVSSAFTALFLERLHIRQLQGEELHSGQPLNIVYIGNLASEAYLQDILFSSAGEIEDRGRLRWWGIRAALNDLPGEIDLLIVEADFPVAGLITIPDALAMPRWVKQRVPIPEGSLAEIEGLRSKTRREAERLARKHEFEMRVVGGAQAAARFFETLYVPYVRERYGQAAELVPRRRFMAECERYEILELHDKQGLVAGSVVRQSGGQLSIVWAGLDTSQAAEKVRVATGVLDKLTLEYAHKQGMRFLDMGPSRARLNDGVLAYKRKWGARLYSSRYPQAVIYLAPRRLTDSVRAVFRESRFIGKSGSDFYCRFLALPDDDTAVLETILQEEGDPALSEFVAVEPGCDALQRLLHGQSFDSTTRNFRAGS